MYLPFGGLVLRADCLRIVLVWAIMSESAEASVPAGHWPLLMDNAHTSLARLCECAHALGADAHLYRLTTGRHQRRLLNIRLPDPIGPAFGEADIVTKRRFFTAEFTFCHRTTLRIDTSQ